MADVVGMFSQQEFFHEAVAEKMCLSIDMSDGQSFEERQRLIHTAFKYGVRKVRLKNGGSDQSIGPLIEGIRYSHGRMLYDLRANGNAPTLERALGSFQLADGDQITVDWRVNFRDREVWEVFQMLGKAVLVNLEPDGTRLFPTGKLQETLDFVRRIGLGGVICDAALFQFQGCHLQLKSFNREGFQYLVTGTATRRYCEHVRSRNGHVLSSTVDQAGGCIVIGKGMLSQGVNFVTTMAEVIEDTILPT